MRRKDILKEIYQPIIVYYLLLYDLSIEIIKIWFVKKCYYFATIAFINVKRFYFINMQIGMDDLEINI